MSHLHRQKIRQMRTERAAEAAADSRVLGIPASLPAPAKVAKRKRAAKKRARR